MLKNFIIRTVKKKLVKDLVNNTIKDLRALKKPGDFDNTAGYNLVLLVFSFWITSGKTPLQAKKDLHDIVDEAYNEFLKQIVDNNPTHHTNKEQNSK